MRGEEKSDRQSEPSPAISTPQLVRCTVLVGLSLLALFVLFPHLQTGFTTRDDADIGLLPAYYGGWPSAAWAVALASGRFYHVVTMPVVFALYRFYLFFPAGFYFLYLGSILANLLLFYFLVRRVFGSKSAAVLAVALWLAFVHNSWQHSLLTSYPVVPHFGLSALFCTFLLLLSWQRDGRPVFAIWAGIAYSFSILVSEIYISFSPILLAICVYRAVTVTGGPVREKAATVARGLWVIALGLAIYLVCYFLFRHFHSGRYDGNRLAPFSPARIFAVLWQWGSSSLPGYFYFRDPYPVSLVNDGFTPHALRFSELFRRCRIEWVAKAIIACTFVALILRRNIRLFRVRSFTLAVTGGFACVFAALLLVSLTPGYQGWVVESGSLAYGLPSYCAYFAVIFLFATILLAANQALARRPVLSMAYVFVACTVVAGGSVTTDYYNHYVTLEQQFSHLKWRTVDRFIRTPEFQAMPEGSVIFAPSLWLERGIVGNSDHHWTEYLSQRSGKRVSVFRSAEQFNAAVTAEPKPSPYFLAFQQEQKDPQQLLVFAPLEENVAVSAEAVFARDFVLFSYGKYRAFTLVGKGAPGAQLSKVEVNGRLAEEIIGPVLFARIDHRRLPGDFPKTEIRSEVPLDVAHLIVSFLPLQPR